MADEHGGIRRLQFQENLAPNRTPRQTTRIGDITRIRLDPTLG
jgi:hypothetical protein